MSKDGSEKDYVGFTLPEGFDLSTIPGVIVGKPQLVHFGPEPLSQEEADKILAKMEADEKKYGKPDWGRFLGCQHERFERCPMKKGGGIQFGRHFGKPLSDRLWEDIVFRLQPHSMWIIRNNEAEWCLGVSNHVTIYLDENDNVRDIYYAP